MHAVWLIMFYQRIYCAGAHKHQSVRQSSNFVTVFMTFLDNVTIQSQSCVIYVYRFLEDMIENDPSVAFPDAPPHQQGF